MSQLTGAASGLIAGTVARRGRVAAVFVAVIALAFLFPARAHATPMVALHASTTAHVLQSPTSKARGLSAKPAATLTSAKAALNRKIATDRKSLIATTKVVRDPLIPATQRAAYARTIAGVNHLAATSFSAHSVAVLRTTKKVAALAAQWQRVHIEIADLAAAVRVTDEYTGGFIDTESTDFTAFIASVRTALKIEESKGVDESVAYAALARIPGDARAVNAATVPVFAQLAKADFTKHSVVLADIRKAQKTADTGPAILRLEADLAIATKGLDASS